MQNLINKDYFWGITELTGMFKADTEAELNKFIAKYQKMYLKDMFADMFEDEIPEDLMKYLVNADTLESPIANYVYYHWQRVKATIQTNAGVKRVDTPNTLSVSPAQKMCDAWNEMVYINIQIHEYLSELEVTPELDYYNNIYPYLNVDVVTHINVYNI